MSKKTELQAWLTAANSVAVETSPGSERLQFPLVTRVGSAGKAGLYKVNAPLVRIPVTGDLFNKGAEFSYSGVDVAAPVVGEWASLDNTKLKHVVRQIATLTSARGKITVAEPVAVVTEPVAVVAEPKVEVPDLEAMTKKQLDSWAATQGIDVDGRLSKTDMVEFVQAELAK